MSNEGRKTFLSVFERRMWENAVDHQTGKAMNIRRHMEWQVHKLKDVLEGKRVEYEPYRTIG